MQRGRDGGGPTTVNKKNTFGRFPLGHHRAPARRLRDRAGLEHTLDRRAAALWPLLAAFVGSVRVLLRRGALASVVRRRALWHAGALGHP